ncbi:MAG: sulfurtransferase [Pseudomonadota bacterium]|nr:sulfurtransferase [Pseudomonadota bacterium]
MKSLSKQMKFWLLAAGLGALATPALAVDMPGPLVDVPWLLAHRNEVQVVEVRSDLETFTQEPELGKPDAAGRRSVVKAAGQIPGSLPLDFSKVRVDREVNGVKAKLMLPGREAFQQLVRDAGVRAGMPIVIASLGQDVTDLDEAARLYWQFKVYGEDHLALLDGGTAAWIAAGQAVVKRGSAPAAGDWMAGALRGGLVATSEDVARASLHGGVQLVDARSLPQYYGISKKPVVASFGHIAGARPLSPELLTHEDHGVVHFNSAATFRDLMSQLGFDPKASTITYCNTGHLAAGAWFSLSEIGGNHEVSLYDGSMHLWSLEKRPVVEVARQ